MRSGRKGEVGFQEVGSEERGGEGGQVGRGVVLNHLMFLIRS